MIDSVNVKTVQGGYALSQILLHYTKKHEQVKDLNIPRYAFSEKFQLSLERKCVFQRITHKPKELTT